jgi:hypothetical protein
MRRFLSRSHDGISNGIDIAKCLVALLCMMLIRNGIEQRGNATVFVVESKVCCRSDCCLIPRPLKQIGEVANEVSRLLWIGGYEHLSFE